MKKIVICISGRGSNMEAILENIENGILHNVCTVSGVFSNKFTAAGLLTACRKGVPVHCIQAASLSSDEYNSKLIELLTRLDPDYIVLAGYMKILSPELVNSFSGKIINIHPADTSLHQGLHAYKWAFENKLNETAITVHYVSEEVDMGDVIGKAPVDLEGATTLEEVERRGLAVEHSFYSEMLKKIFSNNA